MIRQGAESPYLPSYDSALYFYFIKRKEPKMKQSIATRLTHQGNLNLKSEKGILVQELDDKQMYRTVMRGSRQSRQQIPLGFMTKAEVMEKYDLSHAEYLKLRKNKDVMQLVLGTRSVYFFEPQLDKFYAAKMVLKMMDESEDS